MRWLWSSVAFLMALSCGNEGGDAQLIVDIRTDLRSGTDFVDIRTRVYRGEEGAPEREVTTPAPVARDLSTGFRVAEIGGLVDGARRVEVAVVDETGVAVASRTVRVEVSGATAISASVTRTCVGVTCPGAADPPDNTECLGGRCVTPLCAEGDVAACEVTEISLGELMRQSIVAICEMVDRCMGPARAFIFRGDDCRSFMDRFYTGYLVELIETSLLEGRIIYHGEAAFGCLNALRSDCRGYALNKQHLECVEAIEGTVELGGRCFTDFDCAGVDSHCGGCPGVCTRRGQAGEACFDDDECGTDMRCVGEVCVELREVGEACDPAEYSCPFDSMCLELEPGAGPRCMAHTEVFSAGLGEPCGGSVRLLCAEGLSCVTDTLARTCVPWVESGASCQLTAPDQCPIEEYCDPGTLVCTPLPREGAPCVTVDERPRCAADHLCDGSGTCVEIGVLGDGCTRNIECVSQACVSGECVSGC